jgi:hypothetical protein
MDYEIIKFEVESCLKLLGEHVQKISKKLTTWIMRL